MNSKSDSFTLLEIIRDSPRGSGEINAGDTRLRKRGIDFWSLARQKINKAKRRKRGTNLCEGRGYILQSNEK